MGQFYAKWVSLYHWHPLYDWVEILFVPISARSSAFDNLLKLCQAFLTQCVKKSLVELQKFWEISRLVQILAPAKFLGSINFEFYQVVYNFTWVLQVPVSLTVSTHSEVLCTL